MESVLEEYRASLADLTFNSKPLINMLTVLAEENYGYAPDLVRIIENQVYQSPPNQRLPVLYLIDSIVKTYGPYVKLFSPNLIKTFLFVFEKAETKVRHDLFKLRSTWNGMFSKSLLHDLDVAVKQFDPNWPVRVKKSAHPSGLTVEERVAAMMTQPAQENPSRFSSDEDEYNASYQEDNPDSNSPNGGGDILVEEEEILLDDEKYDELEALEKALLKRQEELSKLESINEETSTSGHKSPEEPKSPTVQTPYFIDASAEHHPISPTEESERQSGETQEIRTLPKEDVDMRVGVPHVSTPEHSYSVPDKRDTDTQTEIKILKDSQSQIIVDMQDQTTQYRYRKKTKNFLSQYRVPSKSVATYFRIKTKEVQTQYSPPNDYQDAPADSTSSHPDGGFGVFNSKERSALKEYVAALKDDFLPAGFSKHSGLVLRNLSAQRRQGILCDITVGAEGRVFKAHKSVLAASSDFFYTLFAHEEIEKTPLSHIELQGITAKALSLVLDYIYTSILPMENLSSVEEIIIAAKRLQIHSLMTTCPALEQAVAKRVDMAGWLISNSSLLSPSNRHPYVEALKSLRNMGTGNMNHGERNLSRDNLSGAGDAGAGDFICHVDRDVSSKKRPSDLTAYNMYSNDEAKYKKKKSKHYTDKSETESDFENDSTLKQDGGIKKEGKYDTGVVASPGMPPTSWADMYSPVKSRKKKKRSAEAAAPREQAVYKCNNCHRNIISRRNYIAHCDAHLRKGEKPYGCSLCKKMFWKEEVLESHLLKIHTELTPGQVEQLTKSKVSSSSAEEELRRRDHSPATSKHKNKKCPECNIILQNEVSYARHMRIRHPDVALSGEYRHQCKYCFQYFKTAAARAVHTKKHLRDGDVPQKSKKRKHSGDGGRSGESDEGDSSEENEIAYSSNPEEEEGDSNPTPAESQDSESAIKLKLYQCEICGEMFSIQCFYKAHMAGHKKDLNEY